MKHAFYNGRVYTGELPLQQAFAVEDGVFTFVGTDTQAMAMDADTYMDLYKAIEQLRPEYREVIKLYYLDDLSVKEIAQILNKNENTIKTQLFRARDTLKSVLEA